MGEEGESEPIRTDFDQATLRLLEAFNMELSLPPGMPRQETNPNLNPDPNPNPSPSPSPNPNPNPNPNPKTLLLTLAPTRRRALCDPRTRLGHEPRD